MALQACYFRKTFFFRFEVRTSRGKMPDRMSWFIKIRDASQESCVGIGEAGPLPGLSPDSCPDFEAVIKQITDQFNAEKIHKNALGNGCIESIQSLLQRYCPHVLKYPSLLFAFEVALLDLIHGGRRIIFRNNFLAGQVIPINGLIWMDQAETMFQSVLEKCQAGFRCIKIKVGGLDFQEEINLLKRIREHYSSKDVTLRLDANGAFGEDDVDYRIKTLSRFSIHSIEQPLPPGSVGMAKICARPTIPIALDEELIGVGGRLEKEDLLNRLQPQFIVLKPTLHGGLYHCKEWIQIAESQDIGWWVTSALESNIGLNAIAQFTAHFTYTLPQGLGTGGIYKNNFMSPLLVQAGALSYDDTNPWEV